MNPSRSPSITSTFVSALYRTQRRGALHAIRPFKSVIINARFSRVSRGIRQSWCLSERCLSSAVTLNTKGKIELDAKIDGAGHAPELPHEPRSIPQQHRKHTRSPAVKTSLRRVAVEAQRSKDGSIEIGTEDHGITQGGKDYSWSTAALSPTSTRLVTAYAVAETFDLVKVVEILRKEGYQIDPTNTGLYPQVVHVQAPISSMSPSSGTFSPELGDIFIFPSGTVVTWGLPDNFTSRFASRTLLSAAESPHPGPIETEDLEFTEDPTREHSTIRGETIVIGTRSANSPSQNATNIASSTNPTSTALTKIAFSCGIARSTALSTLESSLATYLHSTAPIPRHLSLGLRLPRPFSSRPFILKKTGELLLLRSRLNLYSELTDSLPDIFWDSPPSGNHGLNLEGYYDQVGRALDVGIRIKLLNEKMTYAAETNAVLRETLSERHGLFLEWTIIVLIAVEVGFEVLRLSTEGFWRDVYGLERKEQKQVMEG